MFDHIALRTADVDALTSFYEKALAPFGVTKLMEFDGTVGLGTDMPRLWLGESDEDTSSVHLAFAAPTRAAVDAFYAAAMAAGGTDNGGPGLRTDYTPTYYAAYVIDPDGNNVEAVCHAPA